MKSPISQRTKATNLKAHTIYFNANQQTYPMKKPFKETRFAQWLKEHDSELFEFAANRIPANKPIGKTFKVLLLVLSKLTDEKKKEAENLLED